MNPLFQAMNQRPNNMSNVMNVIKQLRSGNPAQIAQQMMMQNPQFRQFMEQNKGKDPMQVAKDNGIDLSQFIK